MDVARADGTALVGYDALKQAAGAPLTYAGNGRFRLEADQNLYGLTVKATVTGRLASGCTAYDAVSATFPAGTLSGAPKPRAMQIIDELEPVRRGVYGGCVGYLDFAGNADTAIAIRTAVIVDGTAHVQAGAGIVAESVAASEAAECRNKAAAVLRAVAAASTLAQVGP